MVHQRYGEAVPGAATPVGSTEEWNPKELVFII
jgi:hypothetical protein